MTKSPFEQISKIFTADELISIAFRRADSKSASLPRTLKKIIRSRRKEINKINNVNEYLINKIKDIIQSFPNFEELHPFYREFIDLLIDKDKFKLLLGRLNGIIPILKNIEIGIIKKIKSSEDPGTCAALRRQFFARIKSVIKEQKYNFEELEFIRVQLKKIPAIDISLPSIVISGYPNVGKSSLVAKISTAKPEICEYPFTTKNIIIGVYKDENNTKLFQIIDTPGILDRPMSERNIIEKQAILALRTISNIVIFMIDPTYSCGYSVDNQISLFNEIRNEFIEKVKVPYLVLINKIDIASKEMVEEVLNKLNLEEEKYLKISAKEGPFTELLNRIKYLIEKYRLIDFSFKKLKNIENK